jgi:tetratricopeptide (TPR) repeat protein
LELAAELKPGFADAQGNLAEAFFEAGNRDRAIEVFSKAIEAHPAESVLH